MQYYLNMQPQETSVVKNLDFSDADRFFKTIGEVSAEIGIPPHVLRFWESKFLNIKPHKRKGGHRYYSKVDVEAIHEIKKLLYEQGYTIKGAQKYLREKGYMQHTEAQDQQSLFSEEKHEDNLDITPNGTTQNNFAQPDLLETAKNAIDSVDPRAVKLLLRELEDIKKALEN